MDILQEEVDQIAKDWNSHYVRNQRHLSSSCGIPEKLYHLSLLISIILLLSKCINKIFFI